MFRLVRRRAGVVGVLVFVVVCGGGPGAAAAGPVERGREAIGTVPMVLLVAATLWILGVSLVIAFRRRRTQDLDDH